MIIEFYPNPNKPVVIVPPPAQHAPWVYNANNDFHPKSEHFKKLGKWMRHYNMTEDEVEAKANKLNISIDEWIRRDIIVREFWRESNWMKGQKGYPSEWKEFQEYGEVEIIGVCSSYADFGNDREWSKEDRPLIHLVRCQVDNQMLNTSKEWLSRSKPVEIATLKE